MIRMILLSCGLVLLSGCVTQTPVDDDIYDNAPDTTIEQSDLLTTPTFESQPASLHDEEIIVQPDTPL